MDQSKTPIFDSMAADLASVRPEHQDCVLCPMCLAEFSRVDIRLLTKEHLLSKSAGSSQVTLTCKDCNNKAGQKIQSQLAALLRINDGFRGDGHFRGKGTIFGQSVPVEVRVRPGAGLQFVTRGGQPEAIASVIKYARRQVVSKWSVNVRLPYTAWKASAAIARGAYLTSFHYFGYRYILSEPLNTLRQEIASAMDAHSPRLCLLTGTTRLHSAPNGNEPESVVVPLAVASGCRLFLVMMRFRRVSDYWMFGVLPHPDQPTASMFSELAEAVDQLGKCDITMVGDDSGATRVDLRRR